MPRKTKKEFREVPFELPGDVTVTVRYPKDARPPMFLFDTYVTIGQIVAVPNVPNIEQPVDRAAIEAARAALMQRHPGGPSGVPTPEPSRVVTPESLGYAAMTPESLSGGGGFEGTSNEDDTDA